MLRASDRQLAIVFAMVVTVATIAGIIILAALGKGVADLMFVFTAAAVPAVTVFLGSIHAKVEQAQQNTNGRMTQLIDLIEKQSAQLASMNPAEVEK